MLCVNKGRGVFAGHIIHIVVNLIKKNFQRVAVKISAIFIDEVVDLGYILFLPHGVIQGILNSAPFTGEAFGNILLYLLFDVFFDSFEEQGRTRL